MFAGGATLAAAERVCGKDTLDVLTSLVDKSLVVAVPQPDGPTRYRMLETIRVYAAEKLDAADERQAAEAEHAAFVLDLVEAAEPHLRGRDQLRWLARLRAESDEIDLALRRSIDAAVPVAYRIVVGMAWSWLLRGRIEEARQWLTALPPCRDVDPPVAALTDAYRALAAVGTGDLTGGLAHARAATAAAAGLPEPWHPLLRLVGPVTAVFADHDHGPLRRLTTDADDRWTRAVALQALAASMENLGDIAEQRRLIRAAHAEFAALGERFGLGMVVYSLGELENLAGEHAAAGAAFDEAIALAAELGNDEDRNQYYAGRAMVYARAGDLDAARALIARAIATAKDQATEEIAAAAVQIERLAGDITAARVHLAVLDAAIAADPESLAIRQRRAYVEALHAEVELADDDLPAARALLRTAAEAAALSLDGPVIGMVAEVAAQLAHREGDDDAAVALLALAAARRGTLDRGAPGVVALLAALGPAAEARIAAGAAALADPVHLADGASAAQPLTAFLAHDPVRGR